MMCAHAHGTPVPAPYFAEFVEGRRGEILDAALAVFGEKGYEAGTMREIAARVGVSEPAIYRHYESKEAILGEIVALAGDRISGDLRRGLAQLDADNVATMLHTLIDVRRVAVGAAPAERADASVPPVLRSGAGGVLHTLFHAAPHNENFRALLRAHLAEPMVEAVRGAIPRVDAGFGITRTQEEIDAKVRVFMSLFAGYFTTSMLFDAPPNDEAIVQALLTMMGWQGS